jgi:16S rRNA (adenine1518-N6/adenine1519-N6)-dimethyltransferase
MASLPPYPRKRLGQHFLIDPNLLRKIVSLADIQPSDSVCEIGPVLALEVDPRMVEFLKTELAGYHNLQAQEQDALRYSFEDLPEHTIIVANLPYNISTPIMFRLLEAKQKITRMVLTIQFEVAQRLVAKPGTKDYGVLSVMVQHLAEVTFGFKVSRKCFRPVPGVDSGVVRLDIREGHPEKPEDLAHFQRTVRAAFGQRRKTLLNAFRSVNFSNECLHQIQQDTGISLTRRAETLSVEEFEHLSMALPPF